jgi:hypothetical protein
MFRVIALCVLLAVASPAGEVTEPSKPQDASETGAVVEEILRIQEQMGGSVVGNLGAVESAPPASPQRKHIKARRKDSPVLVLRRAALDLDLTAHRLEMAELYEQADAVRRQAQDLRLKARELAKGAPKQ